MKGITLNETFAPVAKFPTIRCIPAMTAPNGWVLHQMDVKTAFLHGDSAEEVNMKQPERYVDPAHPEKVCRCLQALYGLKTASRVCCARLDACLTAQGFENIDPDACFYLQMEHGEVIMVPVYVDDLLLVASSLQAMDTIKTALCESLETEDPGEAKVILGLEIRRDKTLGILKLSQRKYATEELEKFGMVDCNYIATPLEVGLQLERSEESEESLSYREVVGSLMYLMGGTRPDLDFAVGKLSRVLSGYNKEHWAAVKHVARYAKGSVDKGVV